MSNKDFQNGFVLGLATGLNTKTSEEVLVGENYEEVYVLLSSQEPDPNAEQSLLELANKLIGGDVSNG